MGFALWSAMAKFLCILDLISCFQIQWSTCTAAPQNDFYCGLAGADLRRSSFPSNFIFGVTTSNYQYEGAVNEGGKGPSNYDSFAHIPGNIFDGSNADVALDHYHRYKEDIQLMKDLGVDASRFSISWSRIFPGVGDGDMQFSQEIMYDQKRIDYLNGHLSCLLVAIRNGSNVAGYFTWSLLDNWEWIKGFSIKYGLYHIDLNNLQRYPKQSAYWFKTFLERESHKSE